MSYVRVVTHEEDNVFYWDANGAFSGLAIQILNDIQLNRGIVFNITKALHYNSTEFSADSSAFFQRDIATTLTSNSVDLAVSFYYFLHERAIHNLSILLPVLDERFKAFFIQPHATNGSRLYIAPFGMPIAIVFYSFAAILAISATAIIFKTNKQASASSMEVSFMECLRSGVWSVFSSFTLKSFPIANHSTSLKIFSNTSNLFFWMYSSIYAAFLMSVLSSSLEPIHSFMDLVAHDYSIYFNPSVSSSLSGGVRLYKKPRKALEGNLDSFRTILEGGHAHVDANGAFKWYAKDLGLKSEDLCKEIKVLPFLAGVSSGFYVSRNYSRSMKESLNRGIARLTDVGLLHYYKSRYFEDSVASCPKPPSGYLELAMVHVGKLFRALAITSIFALGALGVELVFVFCTTKKC